MSNEKVSLTKRVLCGFKSPLGWLMDLLVGQARECYCCSFWRGLLWGAVLGVAVTTGVFLAV